MKNPGDVLLVACYEMGHQPLSLASPLGLLRSAGFPASGIDASVEKIPTSRVAQAKFVGIAVPMHTAMCFGIEIARKVREFNPQAYVCFYGLYASLNAVFLLERYANSVIGGEYEESLLRVVRELSDGEWKQSEPGPPGDVTTPILERIPFVTPDRNGLPDLEVYARMETGSESKLAGYVETTRGCLHKCLHCPITSVYEGRFFVVPSEIVLEDIRQLVAQGAAHITFGDPDFLNGPGHSLEVVKRMHDEFPDLSFDITTRVEHILEFADVFDTLKQNGCTFVVSAIESVSDLVLERLTKGHTAADIARALDVLRGADIPMRPSLVAFTPWINLRDYARMLDFVEKNGLVDHIDPVQYTIRLLVPPGSALLRASGTSEWIGPLDEEGFTYRWDHSDRRVDELHSRVSEIVACAADRDQDPFVTFHEIRSLVAEFCGDSPHGVADFPDTLDRPRIPRLTEPWFC